MALLDDKLYILAFIKNAFITSDDTELCELILENDEYNRSRRLTYIVLNISKYTDLVND